MIKPATRTTLYEEVAKQILNVVKRGEWKPGEKIPGEVELSKSFQVSRNCMREALKALELSGIIKSKPGRGTFLREDALRNIGKLELLWVLREDNSLEELMEIRISIESHLTYLAAEHATKEDIEKLKKSLEKVKDSVESKSYSMDIGIEFHMLISEISNNRILIKFLNSIRDELLVQRGALIFEHLSEEELLREFEEHEKIFEYIKNHQPQKAREAMYKHLNNVLEILKRESDKEDNDNE